MTLQDEADEEESINKPAETIPQLPQGMSIIEINHPAFPLGLVATDKNGEFYAFNKNKWDIIDYHV